MPPKSAEIALIGDYSAESTAHRAIPQALSLAARDTGIQVVGRWVATQDLHDPRADLAFASAIWVVPGSPYQNMGGVLGAIRWARESDIPFLGSCGGFQHALIEFARNVARLPEADHAESNPEGEVLVIQPLACPLSEKSGAVRFQPGSKIHAAYGRDCTVEGYNCRYGLDPSYAAQLEKAGMRFTARDEEGQIRAAELPSCCFFIGTLFQSERRALRGETPPIVRALAEFLASDSRSPGRLDTRASSVGGKTQGDQSQAGSG